MVVSPRLRWIASVVLATFAMTAAINLATNGAMTRAMAGADQLAGSEWRPSEVAGDALPADNGLFVRFEANGKIVGHGGCNAFFGSYRITAVNLTIGPLGSTRKACAPAIMKQEAAFLDSLQKTRLFLRDGAKLTLKNGQGGTVVRFIQADWD